MDPAHCNLPFFPKTCHLLTNKPFHQGHNSAAIQADVWLKLDLTVTERKYADKICLMSGIAS